METELKLLIDEVDLKKLDALPVLKSVTVGTPVVQHLNNVYFDTPDFAIRRAGASLRVRHVDGRYVQTLKAKGDVTGGLHQRDEWETDVASERPDLDALCKAIKVKAPYVSFLASPGLADRLAPAFSSDVERTVRHLHLETGEEIEMAVDRGVIEFEENKDIIRELELELKSGMPAHLYTFALELLESLPMRIGAFSKAERGYAMRQLQGKPVVKATRLRLNASMTIENAFEEIIANCMRQVDGNEQGVMHGTDPESVHQMRVGLRRLRSALGVFADVIDCPAVMQTDLKWIACELGEARDWEVLAGTTLDHIQGIDLASINIIALKSAALERARVHREEAAQAIKSQRYTRLRLQFAEWMVGRYWRTSQPSRKTPQFDMPLKQFAKQVLQRGENRLLKNGKRLAENEVESRHRVRIAGKKVRYATEFFGSLYARPRVKHYVAKLSDLQQQLGRLNDAAVAIKRLEHLQGAAADVATSAAFARGYLLASVQADHATLLRAWKRFRKAEVPYAN